MAWMTNSDGWRVALCAALVCGAGACDDGEPVTSTGTTGTSTTDQPVTSFEPTSTIDPSETNTTTGTPDGSDSDGDSGSTGVSETNTTGSTGPATASESSTGGVAPTVESTTPADLESGVPAGTTISVEFSEAMDPATITTNTANTDCTGSLQVSADGFATCVPMMGAPMSGDSITFTMTSADPLDSATVYQIRVLSSATDAEGTSMEADFTTPQGFIVRYFHTIQIDGMNDFDPAEAFATSTPGHTAYVAWDDTYIYLGTDSVDLSTGSDQVWLVAYFGGPGGSMTGVTYNTQQPMLPFESLYHMRWRADDMFGGFLEFSMAAWGPSALMLPMADVATSGSYIEIRVPWADLGDPQYLDLHMCLLREEPFNEASWAAMPSTSFVDGYDPDYTQFFQFDNLGSTLPNDYVPM